MTDVKTDSSIDTIAAGPTHASRTPLYEQLARAIADAIRRGDLAPGTMLQPEPDLAAQLGVNRQTFNQALVGLARHGLVTRRRGVRTLVVEPYVDQPLGGFYSFLRALMALGHVPSTRLLSYRVTVADEASTLLTGRPAGLVWELGRLRLVDGVPFEVETTCLSEVCGERLSIDRLAGEALHDLIGEICGEVVTHAEVTLRPVTLEQPEPA